MVSPKILLPAVLGVLVLTASIVLSDPTPGESQSAMAANKSPVPVQVVNRDPLPTAVMNTVDVHLMGLPPVGIDNPDLRRALPILDVREAARKPFAYWAPFKFEDGATNNVLWTERQTAPADQFVVLEYVNVEACSQPGEKISVNLYVTYDYSGVKGERALKVLMTEQGVFQEPEGVYLHLGASQPMKIYIQPGQQYWFQVWRQGDSMFRPVGHAEGASWMSGYLVPAVQFPPGPTAPQNQ